MSQDRLFPVAQEILTSDDYYTPAWVFDALGIEFDLDVCSPPGGSPWVPARHYYTQEDDGLTAEWFGRVWMNPPYSNTTPWVRRFISHGNGVALVPHAKSRWHIELMETADATCSPSSGYFDFVGGSIFMPIVFAAFGDECVDAISRIGRVRVLRDPAA